MNPKIIFLPVCAQALLTFLVLLFLFYQRVSTMRKNEMSPQELEDKTRLDQLPKSAVNSSDNFENLFEMPVLFFVAMGIIYSIGTVDALYFNLAMVYVTLRAIHSFIHCISNHVFSRFLTFLLSSVVLVMIWIRIATQLWNTLSA